jgi:hypothetical protein
MIEFRQYDYLESETKVTVICDSTSSLTGSRATTLLCRVPRFILPELNTHRVFSRNVASSRAKRFSTLVKDAVFHPKLWIANHKGMQGSELLPTWKGWIADLLWSSSKWSAVVHGYLLDKLGVSKQFSNRTVEPYCYIDYLVSSTEWDNFLYQRNDNAAQFEIQVVARKIKQALEENKPVLLKQGEWHLPFITEKDRNGLSAFKQIQVSVARCARTSYSTPKNSAGMKDIYNKDIALYDTLVNSRPPHLSPTEHQLLCDWPNVATSKSNIQGFTQFRKILESVQFNQEGVSQYV